MHISVKDLILTRGVSLLFVLLLSITASAQDQSVTATIDTSKTRPPISKLIYGQFLEHIGGIVNNNIWAEMLDDRKFYYPITSHPATEPPGPSWRRTALRHWIPVGADEFVTMDTEHPYVGEHSPLVKLNAAKAHGFQQAGLALREGKSYTGRVVLAGTSGATVKVTLISGEGAGDRQSVTISKLGPGYVKFPLHFQSQADSDNARQLAGGVPAMSRRGKRKRRCDKLF
jgi:alpha-L-arabinofuranosidase